MKIFAALTFLLTGSFLSLFFFIGQPIAGEIVKNQKSRIQDAWGSGLYHAPRAERIHKGLDIVAALGEKVSAPFEGQIICESIPYPDDPYFRGVFIAGTGKWKGYHMKIFYVEGLLSGGVIEGQEIATVQDLTKRYPKIINHVHVEVTKDDAQIDPFDIWQMSF
jgi:hypothetical protein